MTTPSSIQYLFLSIFISIPAVHSEDLPGAVRHFYVPVQRRAVAPNPQAAAQTSDVLAQVEPQGTL
jgi:hypothetical protein